MRRLWRYMEGRKLFAAQMVVIGAGNAIAQTGGWLLVRNAIDKGITPHDERHLTIVVVIYQRLVLPRFHHGDLAFLVAVGIVVPVTIAFAQLFASLFERPFLYAGSGRSRVWPPRRAFVSR